MNFASRPAVCVALISLFAATESAAQVSFNRTDIGSGDNAVAIATGDFNRDGRPDIVSANNGSSSVSVSLGNGDGTFGPRTDLVVGSGPNAVIVVDVDRDGALDIVTAAGNPHKLSLFLGLGDGTFEARTDIAPTSFAVSLAAGDFDRDGKIDLVSANPSNHTVSLFEGNGDGTFAAAVDMFGGFNPWAVDTADVNGDGRLDLAVVNDFHATVSILLGNGDGTFGPISAFGTGTTPRSVAFGDLNRDGKLDLVAGNRGMNSVSVLLGNGDGTFGAQTVFATGSRPHNVAVGDVNLDGKPDVLAPSYDNNVASVLLGNGDGTLRPKVDFAVANLPRGFAVADFNGDGRPDLVTGSDTVPGAVSVLVNTTALPVAGTSLPRTSLVANMRTSSVRAADFNRDGALDIAGFSGAVGLFFLPGQGNGTFGARVDFSTAGEPFPDSIAVGDVNLDGRPDIVTTQRVAASVSVFLGDGVGGFTRSDIVTGGLHNGAALADLDRDGDLDLVTGDVGTTNASVLFGDGAGGFGPVTDYAVFCPLATAVADLNRDGLPDLLVTRGCGTFGVAILLGTGGGNFAPATFFATGQDPRTLLVADFNRDGTLDIATPNASDNTMSVLLGNGDGSFATKVDYATGQFPMSIVASDFNRDGAMDIGVANDANHSISILFGNGDGTFDPKVDFATGLFPQTLAAGDFNRDGKPDVATGDGHFDNGGVSLLTNNVNQPPVADAGPDQPAVQLGTAATLDGSASNDPDLDTLSFVWRDQANSVVGTTASIIVTLPLGAHTFTLEVDDGQGGTDTDTVVVTVVDTTPPVIAVMHPNGGEKLFSSTAALIEWTATDNGIIETFDVLVSVNGGSTYSPVAGCSAISGTERSCLWNAPGPASTTARIRVVGVDASGNSGNDASNANFSILAGTGGITLNAPNTAVDWGIGSMQKVTWAHNLGINSYVRIELSRDARESWQVIADSFKNTGATSSTFNWLVTGPSVTSAARVRVTWRGGPVSDVSDRDFTISESYVNVPAPNTTATSLGYGTIVKQAWTTNLGAADLVNVLLSSDGGQTFPTVLASNLSATKLSQDVTIPTLATPTSAARVRVQRVTDSSVGGTSPLDFSVEAPYIAVTSPNIIGDTWTVGSTRAVTWASNLGTKENVTIELSLDGGSSYAIVLFNSTPADGAQNVTVQAGWQTANARVRISWVRSGAVVDVSSQSFAIQ